jgi:hypothetical protein
MYKWSEQELVSAIADTASALAEVVLEGDEGAIETYQDDMYCLQLVLEGAYNAN